MIDILNRTSLIELLNNLKDDDKPSFGMFTPQHMVEHLIFSVRFSNGKLPQKTILAQKELEKTKAFVIDTDNEIPKGIKYPLLPKNDLIPLIYNNLATTINILETELIDFEDYFKKNPSNSPIQPVMGKLTYREWIIFHNKHFTHHFKQFNLI